MWSVKTFIHTYSVCMCVHTPTYNTYRTLSLSFCLCSTTPLGWKTVDGSGCTQGDVILSGRLAGLTHQG